MNNILRKYDKKLFVSIVIITVATYLALDYRGPSEIGLKSDTVFGLSCLRAKELIVQEYDKNGNLWATRGMNIYKLKSGENKFKRIAHIPTGLSLFWLRNFSILRKLTARPECVEVVVTEKGNICALSAGRIWVLPASGDTFNETIKLSHYGFGDQGIRNDGIIAINDSTVFFGEYFQNQDSTNVRIFKSYNNLSSWQVVSDFIPKSIRHIHAIQKDPYTEKLWLLTGDKDKESFIAWSDNEFKSFVKIGSGSQIWRACQLVFTEGKVYWGSDNSDVKLAGIYQWDRKTKEIEKLQKVDGAIMFGTRLPHGTIAFAVDREGLKNEIGNRTRLLIMTDNNKIATIDCGTRNHFYFNWWNKKFAMLRFQRNQDGPSLAITCLNQKEVPDGELIIISEESLQEAAKGL